jgi:hypothetical protein
LEVVLEEIVPDVLLLEDLQARGGPDVLMWLQEMVLPDRKVLLLSGNILEPQEQTLPSGMRQMALLKRERS